MERPQTSHNKYPPFPDDIDAAPLVSISLRKLEANDAAEADRLFEASKALGFFYLDMYDSELGHRVIRGSEGLNELQERWWALPNSEKDKYGRPHLHDFFAYRYGEVPGVLDANGDPIRNQNYNVSTRLWPSLTAYRFAKTMSSASRSAWRATR